MSQGSIVQLLNTVNDVQELLTSNIAQLKVCQAIGGDNPTAIQQIQQATCLLSLVSTVQNDINTVTNNVSIILKINLKDRTFQSFYIRVLSNQ